VRCDEYEATRETIAATTDRIDRIERVISRLLRRFLWLSRIFLGGVLVTMTKFCGVRESFNGF
jgi:hypothetical protein